MQPVWTNHLRKREDNRPVSTRNLPIRADNTRKTEDNDHTERAERQREGQPEALENSWDFDEEIRTFDFFFRRPPGDVV